MEIDVNLQANSPDEVAKPKGDLLKLKSSQIRRKKRKNKKHKDGKKEENTGKLLFFIAKGWHCNFLTTLLAQW